MLLTVTNVKLPFDAPEADVLAEAGKRLARLGVRVSNDALFMTKRSIDARNRDAIVQVCSVGAIVDCSVEALPVNKLSALGITVSRDPDEIGRCPFSEEDHGKDKLSAPPLVVGMGPAGLFCSLTLAENGYNPILIDRGDCVERRVGAVNGFYKELVLDTESNIQFGEGGAGTFSDGKLVTRINDPLCAYVLQRLYLAGAPREILVKAKPHVGTDLLRRVVEELSQSIRALGGKTIYRCRLDSISESKDGTLIAKTSQGDIRCGAIVLATGHSARDTYLMLRDSGYVLSPKPFSMGVRIEHLQDDIDHALFGKFAGHEALGKGEYNLSDTKKDRGVYTFCMCPGGEVVAATSVQNAVVVNGMSNHARDGRNANCAVCVSVNGDDVKAYMSAIGRYSDPVSAAIRFQQMTEERAFEVGGMDYKAPIQLVGDFLGVSDLRYPKRIMPTYMGGNRATVAPLREVLPAFVADSIAYGLTSFDRKLRGFAAPDAVLTAVESRTTAPLRIERGDDLCAKGHDKVYPCGEGAGYAGGITSAAVDGIRCAGAIIKRFCPI